MLNKGMNDLFPTQVYLGQILDQDLQALVINELLTDSKLLNTSNLDDNDVLFSVDNEILNRFKDTVVMPSLDSYIQATTGFALKDFNQHKVKAWVTGRGNNYTMIRHNHQGSYLSSVFYLLAETQDLGGEIVFHDPRSNANRGYTGKFNNWFDNIPHRPETGEYVVFPSFLYHYVNTYRGSNRIAIVVDLFLYDED